MPRISVVVPIYNVEAYLPACLSSLAAQTLDDLEIVMVDDGSTDRGAEIAQRFADRDPRFRLIGQDNAGLGHARNTGAAAAGGELLAFVDSDDVVPPDAYERLAGALDQTGSDFASGNVQRLTGARMTQAPFLARTFAATRLRTHVTRFRPLLADRIACNKLWRRAFWDANGLRFPEGVLHEDIPVTLPAHLMAGSVDVLSATVYRYRIREGEDRSITQRRLELRVLEDRLTAVEGVRAYLAEHGPRRVRRWYDERLVGDDLRLHLDVLADADETYRLRFLERVNPLVDDMGSSPFGHLTAIDRLKWHLARRGLMDELVEVLRFQHERRESTAPLRRRGRWYGDYPFRDDPALAIPRSTYRLGKGDAELSLRATVEELRYEDDRLVVRGHAHIDGLSVAAPRDQGVQLLALRPGRWSRLRLRATAVRVPAHARKRPDLGGDGAGTADRTWSGFEAALPVSALRGPSRRWSAGTWQLYVHVRAGSVRRRLVRFTIDELAAVELPAAPELSARAVPHSTGRIEVKIRDRWASARDPRLVDGDVIELAGELRMAAMGPEARLEARRVADGARVELPVTLAGQRPIETFSARVPLSELVTAETRSPSGDAVWQLSVLDGGRRVAIGLADDPTAPRWWSSGRELALTRTLAGDGAIVVRDVRPLVTAARWAGPTELELELRLPAGALPRELVLVDWHRSRESAFALEPGEEDGVFTVRVHAPDVVSVAAGPSPRRGSWQLYGRPLASSARAAMARVRLDPSVAEALPLTAVVDQRPFTLDAAPDGGALLSVPERAAARAPSGGANGREASSGNAQAFAG